MRMCRVKRYGWPGVSFNGLLACASLAAVLFSFSAPAAQGQEAAPDTLEQRLRQLNDAMAKTQAQVDESQRALAAIKRQLMELQREMAQGGQTPPPADDSLEAATPSAETVSASMRSAIQDLRERQAVTESEIATHEQEKVESSSKYPLRISGLLLMNAFVNRGAVDLPATPSVAIPGSGNAGASVRQTLLGFEATGPHLFGARSFADLHVDFYGTANTVPGSYSGYNNAPGLLRLRTVHASLAWNRAQMYFSLDRPIISPDSPTSLTATALPPLAWSGSLWTWNPQLGVSADVGRAERPGVELQIAAIDVWDAPLTPYESSANAPATPPSGAEQSSKPGVEARIALLGALHDRDRNHLGFGGYFAPHESSLGRSYDSWAATLDQRLALPAGLQVTSSLYRGRALGGLGGGAYKDFAYAPNPNTGGYYFRPLDDAGGWAELKERVNERLEFNGAAGIDNVFARQLRRYYAPTGSMMQNLARNRTYTGNVIYSPSAYLLFSLEYRRIESIPVAGAVAHGNVLGAAAGYKF